MAMTPDCDGVCVPASYLGDKICDKGARGANLNCAQLQNDRGDCGTPLENSDKMPDGGIMKKIGAAHSGFSSKINSATGRSEGSKLPDLIIAAILLCCVARKYKQQRDLNGPPSWTKTQTKIRYQAVSSDDVEDQQSDAASDEIREPPKVRFPPIVLCHQFRWCSICWCPAPRNQRAPS
jgi:hypothetical protein